MPKGSKSAIDDRDFTIATIVAPSALKSEEADSDEAPSASEVPVVGEEPTEGNDA